MNIPLKYLDPNPFVDPATYPYDRAKLDRLKSSIRTTGFWDNLIARDVVTKDKGSGCRKKQ